MPGNNNNYKIYLYLKKYIFILFIFKINIEICESETYGVVLRYCPLEAPDEKWQPEEEAVLTEKLEAFSLCLEQQLDILMATVSHKETFLKLVEQNNTLRLVEMPGWAGGIIFFP